MTSGIVKTKLIKTSSTPRKNSFVSPSSISSILSSASTTNDDDSVELIAKYIGPADGYELDIRGKNFGPHGGYLTAQWLKKNRNVKRVDISENYLQDEGIIYFAIGIKALADITHLNVSKNAITDAGMKILLENIAQFKVIVLDLSGNLFGSNVDGLVRLLETNTSLKELYLNSIALEEDGAKKLGVCLSLNRTIRKLEIGWNHMRMNGAAVFSRGLTSNATLEEINLSYNGFSLEGAVPFSDCIKFNRTLVKLDLCCNRMTLDCASTLANALHQNSTLKYLNLSNNPLTSSGVHQILFSINNDKSKIEYLGLKNVAIVKIDLLLIEFIQKRRKFMCEYGHVLLSPDHIGSNIPVEEQPIMKLAKYLSEKRLRIIDMFRLIDRRQLMTMERVEFIKRLKIFEPRLRLKEIIFIADGISKDDQIDYSRLYQQVYHARNEVLLQENLLIKQKLRTLKRNRIYMNNLQRQFKVLLSEYNESIEPTIDKWLNESVDDVEKLPNTSQKRQITLIHSNQQSMLKLENAKDSVSVLLNDLSKNSFKYKRFESMNSKSLQNFNDEKNRDYVSIRPKRVLNESLLKIEQPNELTMKKETSQSRHDLSSSKTPLKRQQLLIQRKTNEIIQKQNIHLFKLKDPNERTRVRFDK